LANYLITQKSYTIVFNYTITQLSSV